MPAPPTIRSIPEAYGAARDEYRALREGCAIDRVAPRILADVEAADAPTALAALRFRLQDPGSGAVRAAIVRDADGRLTACATVVRRASGDLLVDISNPTGTATLDAAGASYARHGEHVVRMRLRGPALAEILGAPAPAPGDLDESRTFGGRPALLCGTAPDRVAIYCDRANARDCWNALVAAGAVPAGSAALETVRIEDAEPCLERDFRQPLAPATAGLAAFGDDAPEVLVALEHEGATPLERAVLRDVDGAEVGRLCVGAAGVRNAGRPIALGTIARRLAAPGTPVNVDAGEVTLAGIVTCRAALPVRAAAPNY